MPEQTGRDRAKSLRSTRRAIDRLDGRERLLSFVASGAAVLFGVTIYLAETNNKHFRLTKGQLTPQTTLLLAIGAGVLLLGATYIGRRAPVAFVSLLVFLMFGTTSFVVGLPFLILGGWLLYHSYKVQKEATATLRATKDGTASSTSSTSGRETGSGRERPPRASTARNGKASTTRSEPSKRYTPKRPPRPAPKPSRRDRKSAQTSE
jgi:hypothetical protein